MKRIPLTQGYFAIVDNCNYNWLNQYKWSVCNQNGFLKAVSWVHGKNVSMHRLIMNPPKGMDVDHINHDALDNKLNNLRVCTRSQNCCNQKPRVGTSSHFKGVTFNKKCQKWVAQITKNGKYHWIGSRESEIEASELYNEKAKELFGEFAYEQVA